jgi:hypothetical protein
MAATQALLDVLSRAQPLESDGSGTLLDPLTNRLYSPVYGATTGQWSDASDAQNVQTGWRGYDNLGAGQGGEDYHNTPYDSYDMDGNQTGSGMWNIDSDLSKIAIAAVVGLGGAFIAGPMLAGEAAAGAGTTASVAGPGDAAWGMGLDSTIGAGSGSGAELLTGGAGSLGSGALDLGGGLSMGPGGEIVGETLAGGGTMTNADILSMMNGAGLGGTPYINPGIDSAQSGQPLNTTNTGPAVPSNFNPDGTGNGINNLTNPGGDPVAPNPTSTAPPAPRPVVDGSHPPAPAPSGNFDLSGLMNLIGGLSDRNSQNHASEEMLNYLKSRQTMNDNMYAPGSNEYNALWDEMSRKDAAAGRNSQYGPRSVDLGARIAQLKMDANTKMTTGIGNLYQNAVNQNASSDAGLYSALGQLFNSNSGLINGNNIGSLTGYLTQLFGGSGGNGGITAPGGQQFGSDLGFDDPYGS